MIYDTYLGLVELLLCACLCLALGLGADWAVGAVEEDRQVARPCGL